MAFSFQASNDGNEVDAASPMLAVSPTTAIITENAVTPGQTVTATVNVSNTGDVDEFYTVTASWSPGGTTSQSAATRLANELIVSVTAGSPDATASPVFVGTMAGLLDQPASPGRSLTLAQGTEDVQFQVILPDTASPVFQGIQVGFDFVFVAIV